MSNDIFLLQGEGDLVPMRATPYDSEDVLQALITRHPELLAGDRGDGSRPPLLLKREAAVPDTAAGGGRWSLDALFLDQDAVPILVEVKRSTDTRIRREVVGQMLDYASNAVAYWSIEALRADLATRLLAEGDDLDDVVARLIGPDRDTEEFWRSAAANLKAGRLRLVFLADEIPSELRRVVEFLNEQMDAEVIAIEVKQYVSPDSGLKTLVPRLLGQTAVAEARKASAPSRKLDEATFFQLVEEKHGREGVKIARDLHDWANSQHLSAWWGSYPNGSFTPTLKLPHGTLWPIAVYTTGFVEIGFIRMKSPPFDDFELRHEFRRRINTVPGVDLPEDTIDRRPSIKFSTLAANPTSVGVLRNALDWFCEMARMRHDASDRAARHK